MISVSSYFGFLCLDTDLADAGAKLRCPSRRRANGQLLGRSLPYRWFGSVTRGDTFRVKRSVQQKVWEKEDKDEPLMSEIEQNES